MRQNNDLTRFITWIIIIINHKDIESLNHLIILKLFIEAVLYFVGSIIGRYFLSVLDNFKLLDDRLYFKAILTAYFV